MSVRGRIDVNLNSTSMLFNPMQLPFLGFHEVAEVGIALEDLNDEDLIDEDPIDLMMILDQILQEVVPRGASMSALNKLKERTFFEKKGDDGDELSGDCVICLEGLSGSQVALTKMKCNHIFHEECITRWLKVQNSCPTCRRELED
ncbi:hypothetical protein P3X46_022278 [Hevea brasiliensis]|uniref:RING-type domain-containing protein n=1 Tax=Hevea brasiliensis TaxID=3981 RepID=A0ABQ9L7F6_HEVBR|nr:uncharacterized protein LOC131172071 [Hevea brasiliensis]KAJ9162513.1 hypothetical protein P3X46_022278 [Hevea brasiliensis]